MHDPFMPPQTLRDSLLLLLISVGLDIMKSFCKLSCTHISSVQKTLRLTLHFFSTFGILCSCPCEVKFLRGRGIDASVEYEIGRKIPY